MVVVAAVQDLGLLSAEEGVADGEESEVEQVGRALGIDGADEPNDNGVYITR